MTNLLATTILTLLTTNVVTHDNARTENVMIDKGNWMTFGPKEFSADKKVEITTITEKRFLKFAVEGKAYEQLLSERPVSVIEKKFELKPPPPPPPPEWVLKATTNTTGLPPFDPDLWRRGIAERWETAGDGFFFVGPNSWLTNRSRITITNALPR